MGKALVCGVESINGKKAVLMENGSVNGEWMCKWVLERDELSNIPSAALLDPGKSQANGRRGFLVPPESICCCCHPRLRVGLGGHADIESSF